MNSHLIIRLCRRTFSDGRHCHGAAVRGCACCRHHLDARTRLHNMARARRLSCLPRLRVPVTGRDLALNRAEVLRVVDRGAVDFATARMMLWAMDLSVASFRSERTSRPISANNPNVSYHVPINRLFQRIYTEHHSQTIENTGRLGEGVHFPRTDVTQPPSGGVNPVIFTGNWRLQTKHRARFETR
jgi:hypothetical protein